MTTAQEDLQAAIQSLAKSLAEVAEQIGKLGPAAPQETPATPTAKPIAKKAASKKAVAKKSVTQAAAPTKKAVTKKKFSPVDSSTPAAIREDRQRMILKQLDADGGVVTKQEWLKIAARYGYDSRRLGGFFGKFGTGMVKMSPDQKMVHLTEYGKARLQ